MMSTPNPRETLGTRMLREAFAPESFKRRPLKDRLDAQISFEPNSGCWLWCGVMRGKYGSITVDEHPKQVHRVAYEIYVGPIPVGLEIDHICRQTICCNPDHLEAVTRAENMRRVKPWHYNRQKSACIHGHALDAANTRVTPDGRRTCRKCAAESMARGRARRKQQ